MTPGAVFEKSWRVLARGSNGIRALEPPPRPRISVIRCSPPTATGAGHDGKPLMSDLRINSRAFLFATTMANCSAQEQHNTHSKSVENRTGLVSCFGYHGLTVSLDIPDRGFFMRQRQIDSVAAHSAIRSLSLHRLAARATNIILIGPRCSVGRILLPTVYGFSSSPHSHTIKPQPGQPLPYFK